MIIIMIRVGKRLEVGGEVGVLIKVRRRGGRTEGAMGCSWDALAGPPTPSLTKLPDFGGSKEGLAGEVGNQA